MTSAKGSNQNQKISLAQRELIDRFIASYNTIDDHLRLVVRNKQLTFKGLIRHCESLGLLQNDEAGALSKFADLRNVLVHESLSARQYPAVPTAPTVEEFERLRESLVKPDRVMPKYRKTVEVISIDDNLSSVLRTISQRDYSQFPVYEKQVFKGLLTENGITRWLAHHVNHGSLRPDFDEACVRHALKEEEYKRMNFRFISRETTITQLKLLFGKHELLEAALITQHGKNSEMLLGIVTRWDIVQLT